jgi:pimeloyl-ACP methyl ester carboxylesterase
MQKLDTWSVNLERHYLTAHGVKTAVFAPKGQKKPDVLLIHGINGSHYGLAEIAQRLADLGRRPVLVDLPGHSDSEIPDWCDLANLQRWMASLYQQLATDTQLEVIAHSFGCYAVSPEVSTRVIFLCPVPTGNFVARFVPPFANAMFHVPAFVHFFNWPAFAYFRGVMMLHRKSKNNRRKVRFITHYDFTSVERRRYQAKLSQAIQTNTKIFEQIKPATVVVGKFDCIAKPNSPAKMRLLFPESNIIYVSSGHMPNVECIKHLAEIAL